MNGSDYGQCDENINDPNTTVCRPRYEWDELHQRIADLEQDRQLAHRVAEQLRERVSTLEQIEKTGNQVRAELFCDVALLRITLERAHEYVSSLRALGATTGPTVDAEIKRYADALRSTR